MGGSKLTVRQYLTNWLTKRNQIADSRHDVKDTTLGRYKNIVGAFLRFLEKTHRDAMLLRNLTTDILNEFLHWRVQQTRFRGQSAVNITPSGANREWKLLRSLFKKAHKDRLISVDVTEEVVMFNVIKLPEELPAYEVIGEVLAALEEKEALDFIVTVALTGMRPGEVAHLAWGLIDMARGLLRVRPLPGENWTPKRMSSIRDVPMPDLVRDILVRIRNTRPGEGDHDPVFRMTDGRPFAKYPNRPYRCLLKAQNTINRRRKAAGLAPIPRIHNRLLRHVFISWSQTRAGDRLNPLEVMRVAGHSTLDMQASTYFHADLEGETSRRMRSASYLPPAVTDRVAPAPAGEDTPTSTDNPAEEIDSTEESGSTPFGFMLLEPDIDIGCTSSLETGTPPMSA